MHVIVLVDSSLLFPFTLWQPIPSHLWVNLWVERERRETHETDACKNKNTPHWQKNFNKEFTEKLNNIFEKNLKELNY